MLSCFVSFPSSYTESLILSALTSRIPSLSLSVLPPDSEGDLPQLQWADYDLMVLDHPAIHAHPPIISPTSPPPNERHMLSSYIYRKALIRKHMLHRAIEEYKAKLEHRSTNSTDAAASLNVLQRSIPQGWTLDVQFADELDELLMDELYDLKEALDRNEQREEGDAERQWFILKPGMSDKAQGIRMFSTVTELEEIFASFEPESDEEEEADEGDEELERIKKLAIADFPDDEPYVEETTGVQLSQLRHFVIQEYVPKPVLFDPLEGTRSLQGHKFHLRAYVLLSGTYKLYLSRTLLALFSSEPFAMPQPGALDADGNGLTAHLTNTCLQASAVDPSISLNDYVKLFWELEGKTILKEGGIEAETVTEEWLEDAFEQVGKVIAETIQATVECGSFGLQLLENAFEASLSMATYSRSSD